MASNRAWDAFLYRLAENESTLAEIAQASEPVLVGILDDFGFSNLEKAQVLTRFKQEAPKIAKAQKISGYATLSPSVPSPVLQPQPQPQPQPQRQAQPQPQPSPHQANPHQPSPYHPSTSSGPLLRGIPSSPAGISSNPAEAPKGKAPERAPQRLSLEDWLNANRLGHLLPRLSENDVRSVVYLRKLEESRLENLFDRMSLGSDDKKGLKAALKADKDEFKEQRNDKEKAKGKEKEQGRGRDKERQQEQETEKAPPKTNDSFVILPGYIYQLMGKRGETLGQLEKQLRVHIGREESENDAVRLNLWGNPSEIAKAKKFFEGRAKEIKQKTQAIEISSKVLGSLIGRQGQKIKQMEETYHVSIIIDEKNKTAGGSVPIRIYGENGSDANQAKKKIVIQEFFDLIDHFLLQEDTLILEVYANLGEDAISYLVGRDGDRTRSLMNTSGTLVEVNNIFGLKRVLLMGQPDDVEKGKKELDRLLTAFGVEKRENRFVAEKKHRFSINLNDYYYLVCSHDRDLASFPDVRIFLYSTNSNAEVVVEGGAQAVDEVVDELKSFLAYFHDPSNGFARKTAIFRYGGGNHFFKNTATARRIKQESGCILRLGKEDLFSLEGYGFQIQRALERIQHTNHRGEGPKAVELIGDEAEKAAELFK